MGLRVKANPVVVQFACGDMKPLQPRFFCSCNICICSLFIPGTSIGTSFSYLNADAVLNTGINFANRGSILMLKIQHQIFLDLLDLHLQQSYYLFLSWIVLYKTIE